VKNYITQLLKLINNQCFNIECASLIKTEILVREDVIYVQNCFEMLRAVIPFLEDDNALSIINEFLSLYVKIDTKVSQSFAKFLGRISSSKENIVLSTLTRKLTEPVSPSFFGISFDSFFKHLRLQTLLSNANTTFSMLLKSQPSVCLNFNALHEFFNRLSFYNIQDKKFEFMLFDFFGI
jgi:hypothetical protein